LIVCGTVEVKNQSSKYQTEEQRERTWGEEEGEQGYRQRPRMEP
jgi:hypothetical protein